MTGVKAHERSLQTSLLHLSHLFLLASHIRFLFYAALLPAAFIPEALNSYSTYCQPSSARLHDIMTMPSSTPVRKVVSASEIKPIKSSRKSKQEKKKQKKKQEKRGRQQLTLIFINNSPILFIVVSYSDSSLIVFLVMFPNKQQYTHMVPKNAPKYLLFLGLIYKI